VQQGQIYGWGLNDFGQTMPPIGNDFIAIAAAMGHNLALKSDGSIVGWGINDYAQATPPIGNDFIAIAAGYRHSLALKSDGLIVGWGAGEPGETGWPHYGQATPPDGNDFVAIAAGMYHSLALKSDGSIVGWGRDDYGQVTPPPGNDFIAIAAHGWHSLALKSDGSIVGWGAGESGETAWPHYGQATPPPGYDFIAITAGLYHSLALKSDGSIVGWGNDYYGEATPPSENDFIAIAAGSEHSLALKSDGSIVGWGRDNYGQATPPDGNEFIAIAGGGFYSLAIRDVCSDPPAGDLDDDCRVDMVDFAILGDTWMSKFGDLNWDPASDISDPNDNIINALDLAVFVNNWLTGAIPEPDRMVWVYIDDSGAGMKDENGNPISQGGFTGEMSKYETTNSQYCQFLNSALASGDITVGTDNIVYGARGSNSGADFEDEIYFDLGGLGHTGLGAINGGAARINWTGSSFTVDSGFENHPVTYVSWYGSTAFADYYGWRLPTEWEWQAVADHEGEFIYGCGTSINNSMANYRYSTHPDGTTIVGSFGAYGYGVCDMAGNVWEWTSSLWLWNYTSRIARGGGWHNSDYNCSVSYRGYSWPESSSYGVGFRVCR